MWLFPSSLPRRLGRLEFDDLFVRFHAPTLASLSPWGKRKAQPIADVLGEEGFARNLSQTDLEYSFSED